MNHEHMQETCKKRSYTYKKHSIVYMHIQSTYIYIHHMLHIVVIHAYNTSMKQPNRLLPHLKTCVKRLGPRPDAHQGGEPLKDDRLDSRFLYETTENMTNIDIENRR